MITAIILVLILYILPKIHSHRLRKIFNFRRELRKIRKQRKPKIKQPVEISKNTLIGHAGKRPVYIPDTAKHVFICGTTGSGKTVAISNFINHITQEDLPALIVDGKGDTDEGSILDIVTKMTANTNKKLYVINLSDPTESDQYNPFRNASPTVAKDMLINMSDWSEEHYKLNAEIYIQRILQLLEINKTPPSFKKITKCINADNFTSLSGMLLKKELITKEEHLENMEILNTSGKTVQGSMARFSTIAESELQDVLTDEGIDISGAMQENAIILFVLNPLVYPELSPAFGRLILIDAKKAIGALFKNKTPRTFFIMDEKILMQQQD